jgi:Mg-chelatase subunit ChlD
VRDRTYSHDVKDTAPNKAVKDTLFPAFDCEGSAPAPLLPLTSNWNALRDKIEDMRPIGNTNVAIGLAWGWHALTPSAPLGEAKTPANDLDKVLIILTDGDNTESWDNKHQRAERDRKDIDARTELACQNVKASGIKVYAIRVIDGNADLLRQCATNSSMYYDVQDSSELNNVFSAIAQNLASLRLAK